MSAPTHNSRNPLLPARDGRVILATGQPGSRVAAWLTALALVLAVPGCADRARQVNAALARYSTQLVAMASDSLAATYAPNGELSHGNQAPVVGPVAIGAFLASFSAYHVIENEMRPESTYVARDTARQWGTYRQRVRAPAGDTLEADGRFDAVWVRTSAGPWQLLRMHTANN